MPPAAPTVLILSLEWFLFCFYVLIISDSKDASRFGGRGERTKPKEGQGAAGVGCGNIFFLGYDVNVNRMNFEMDVL